MAQEIVLYTSIVFVINLSAFFACLYVRDSNIGSIGKLKPQVHRLTENLSNHLTKQKKETKKHKKKKVKSILIHF